MNVTFYLQMSLQITETFHVLKDLLAMVILRRVLYFLAQNCTHFLIWRWNQTTAYQYCKSVLYYKRIKTPKCTRYMFRPSLFPSSGRCLQSIYYKEFLNQCKFKIPSFKMYGLKYISKYKIQIKLWVEFKWEVCHVAIVWYVTVLK
jgi:hypothetical protein